MAELCLEVAERLIAQGIGVTVVDPRWVKPVDPALVPLAARHDLVVTVEDGVRSGGVGGAVAQALRDAGVRTPLRDFGIPEQFLDHAKPAEVRAEIGLTAQEVSRQVVEAVASLAPESERSPEQNRSAAL
jgi:1-deoxy-D-xylulose-5-phosphate synthase